MSIGSRNEALGGVLRCAWWAGDMGLASVAAAMIEALVLIGVFVVGLVAGYVTGWDHGTARGFDVGWKGAMQEVRRVLARTKGAEQ